jgi:hypothetical protein
MGKGRRKVYQEIKQVANDVKSSASLSGRTKASISSLKPEGNVLRLWQLPFKYVKNVNWG